MGVLQPKQDRQSSTRWKRLLPPQSLMLPSTYVVHVRNMHSQPNQEYRRFGISITMMTGSSTTVCFSSASFLTSLSISSRTQRIWIGHMKPWNGGMSKSHFIYQNFQYLNEPSHRQVFSEKSEKSRTMESGLSGAQWLKHQQDTCKLAKKKIGMWGMQ